MANVYSTQFLAVAGASSGRVYVVPAGEVWVLRDITMFQGSQAVTPIARVLGPAGACLYYAAGTLLASTAYHEECRVVLEPGDSLSLEVDDGDCDCVLSGYVLSLP